MEIMNVSFQIIIVILGLIAVGFYMVARKLVPQGLIRMLNSLATEVALPFFIFIVFMKNFDVTTNKGWWQMPLWWLLFTALEFFIVLLFCRIFKKSVRVESSLALFLNNPHFIPISVIIGYYGITSHHLANLFLFTIFSIPLYFNVYKLFFKKSKHLFSVEFKPMETSKNEGKNVVQKSKIDWKKINNPVIKATVIGFIIKLFNLDDYIPQVVISVSEQIGNMTFPLLMLIVGGTLFRDMKKAGKIYIGHILRFALVKNIVVPALMIFLLYVFKPPFPVALLLALQAASPPISTVPELTRRMNGNVNVANQLVVSSFFISIVVIPLMLYFLDLIYV